jgi:hypothetical protein
MQSGRKSSDKRQRGPEAQSPVTPRSPGKGGQNNSKIGKQSPPILDDSIVVAPTSPEDRPRQHRASIHSSDSPSSLIVSAGPSPGLSTEEVAATSVKEGQAVSPSHEKCTIVTDVGSIRDPQAQREPVPSEGQHYGQRGHRRSHGHPTPRPKHDPAHFDETIGPLPSHVENRGEEEVPTREELGGSRVGVGSLPGPIDEVGVAELPDEHITTGWYSLCYILFLRLMSLSATRSATDSRTPMSAQALLSTESQPQTLLNMQNWSDFPSSRTSFYHHSILNV